MAAPIGSASFLRTRAAAASMDPTPFSACSKIPTPGCLSGLMPEMMSIVSRLARALLADLPQGPGRPRHTTPLRTPSQYGSMVVTARMVLFPRRR